MPSSVSLPFDAILFDLGSTLIYYDGDWTGSRAESNTRLLDSLLANGLRLNRRAFLAKWESRLNAYQNEREEDLIEHSAMYVLQSVLSDLGCPPLPETTLREVLAEMYAITQQYWRAEPDAAPTLGALKSLGYRLGVLSNAADDEDVQALIDQAGLRHYFDFILTSASLGFRKPHPHTFQAALDLWGLQANRAAMVGDNLRADIGGANNLGIFSIWITRRTAVEGSAHTGKPVTPGATIQTLSELLPLLDKLNPN